MPQRAKRVYTVDVEPYRELVAEFLVACAQDASYGVEMAKTAMTIKAKRRSLDKDVDE